MSRRFTLTTVLVLLLLGAVAPLDSKVPKTVAPFLPKEIFQEHFLTRPALMDHFEDLKSEFESPNIAVSGDAKYLVIGTCQPKWMDNDDYEFYFYLLVYDVTQKAYAQVLCVGQEFLQVDDSFADVQVSPDDRLVAVTWSNAISVYDFDNTKGKLEHKWTKRIYLGETVACDQYAWCTFSEDGKRLLVTCPPHPRIEFDTLTGRRLLASRHSKVVPGGVTQPFYTSGAVRSSPRQIALLLDNWCDQKRQESVQGIVVYDFDSKQAKFLKLEEPSCYTRPRLAFQPGKNLLVAAYVAPHPKIIGRALQLLRWEWETNSVQKDLLGTYWMCCSDLLFSPDGAYLLVLLVPNWIGDPGLLVIDTTEWKVLKGYRLPSSRGYRGVFAQQAKQLVLLSCDAHLLLVDWPKFVDNVRK